MDNITFAFRFQFAKVFSCSSGWCMRINCFYLLLIYNMKPGEDRRVRKKPNKQQEWATKKSITCEEVQIMPSNVLSSDMKQFFIGSSPRWIEIYITKGIQINSKVNILIIYRTLVLWHVVSYSLNEILLVDNDLIVFRIILYFMSIHFAIQSG